LRLESEQAWGEGGSYGAGSSSGLEMERTASSGGLLGSGICVPLILISSGCEIIGHTSGRFGGRSMGTHLNGSARRRENALYLV
jgi:hypothetical protein